VYGGSLQNHIFLISAAVATFPNAPDSLKAVLDDAGAPEKNPDSGALENGPLTPDGHVVGTVYSVNTPHPATTPPGQLVPSQTMPTIGDELSASNVDWAGYAGGWNAASASDFVPLDAQDRHRRRVVLVGEPGATYLLALPKPAQLRDGDGLLLEDGAMVRVTGKAEPLVEISAANARELARLAWHIGNRHLPLQAVEGRLRIRADHVIASMVEGLGGRVTWLEAPFDPEIGAYAGTAHAHEP